MQIAEYTMVKLEYDIKMCEMILGAVSLTIHWPNLITNKIAIYKQKDIF